MVPIGTESSDMTKQKKIDPAFFNHAPIDDLPPRRRAILAAAFHVLREQGYVGASTLEIATRAKVSKRELYAEFGNKAGILEALVTSTATRMRAPLDLSDIVDRQSVAATLTRYGMRVLSELSHPAVTAINRMAAAEAGPQSEIGRILERSGREPNRIALRQFIASAQNKGILVAGDPNQIGGQFFALLMSDIAVRLMLGTMDPPDAREIERRAEAATDAVLQLYASPTRT
jgi:AcrR family transcriptional regulator